ncbi:hypothetical protein B5K11_11745 [Rhizobium leguminosarum bv. trifolii]|uniref:hypothetical protein n=1 Tax=Rhizobium leguminosarum TaxID=384 RepID=UPI000E2FA6AF|nr:hypothetical protein [Rhizobium leguminosarum]RFB95576.1 hypothetical protein B5K11_11745 [Rhizobium leguminosarum bv. trifolii]
MASKVSITEKLSALFSAQAKAAAELRHDLNHIEMEVVTNQNRLGEVRRAPVELEEIERRVDAFLLEEEADARGSFVPSAISKPEGSARSSQIVDVLGRPRTALGALIILGFRDQLREALVKEAVDAAPAKPIGDAERERETKRLTAEIQKLELIREKIARLAEAQGISVPRSEHADPAALLAGDGEL